MGEVSPAFCSWKTSAPSGLMKVFFAFSLWSFTYATFAAAASSKGSSTSNLSSLLAPEIKFVFVGGKGGVGKTTTSSGLATQLAKDQRILLVSTDPAHSQSDAWAPQQFSNVPKAVEGLKNLDIVELSPKDSLQKEIDSWDELASDEPQVRDFIEKAQDTMKGLQGIDEAIALSEAYDYIHSGAYDKVVFDTAPTGHTLRLLDLPAMMSKALETIRDMQSNLLNLVDMASSIFGAQGSVGTGMSPAFKEVITAKLEQYQEKVDRVASMLSNERATRFVVVCIAEYLSISETKRLLSELKSRRVTASHVVVNQLVDQDLVISSDERDDVVAALETKNSGLSDKVVGALEVFRSKAAIQQKYLKTLKESDEVRQGASTNSTSGIAVVEVPLLASEVVGVNALKTFSRLLLQNPAEVREITRNWNRSKQTPDTPSVKKESAKKAAVKIATKAAAKGESKKTKKTKKKYKKITEEMVEQKTRMLIADMFMNEKMPDLKKWEPILKKDSMLLAQTMQGSPDFLKKAENCKDMEDVSACIDELMKDPIAKTLLREVARAELAEEAVEPVDEYAGIVKQAEEESDYVKQAEEETGFMDSLKETFGENESINKLVDQLGGAGEAKRLVDSMGGMDAVKSMLGNDAMKNMMGNMMRKGDSSEKAKKKSTESKSAKDKKKEKAKDTKETKKTAGKKRPMDKASLDKIVEGLGVDNMNGGVSEMIKKFGDHGPEDLLKKIEDLEAGGMKDEGKLNEVMKALGGGDGIAKMVKDMGGEEGLQSMFDKMNVKGGLTDTVDKLRGKKGDTKKSKKSKGGKKGREL